MAPLPALPASWQGAWGGDVPLSTPLGECDVRLWPEAARVGGGLRLSPRRGGERLRLAGRGSRDLKRLLQERAVPPWERQRLLVVWHLDRGGAETVVALLDPVGERWLAVAAGWRASP